MLKNLCKNQINILNVFIGFSILLGFGFVVKKMFYDHVIAANVEKTHIVAQQLLAIKHYVAELVPHIQIKDKSTSTFAISPAFIGSAVSKVLEDNGYAYVKQTSSNYRNSNNAPDVFEKIYLQDMKKRI